jgi:antitoxin (DNA-binding transcriptional repressor) of toxin-antitoxin stability system
MKSEVLTVGAFEAKTHLSRLWDAVEQGGGGRVRITRRDPVVDRYGISRIW